MNFRRGMNRLGLVIGFVVAAAVAMFAVVSAPRDFWIGEGNLRRLATFCLGWWVFVWAVMAAIGWALDGFRSKRREGP